MRDLIDEWVALLHSGDGDYKKLYTEDYLILLKIIGLNNVADDDLFNQLNNWTKNHPVTGKTTPSQAKNLLLKQIEERNKRDMHE